MKHHDKELSIIIVNFNTHSLTRECLLSLEQAKTDGDSWEVIVVDNGSERQDVEDLYEFIKEKPKRADFIEILESPSNVGFSAGNNIGMKKAVGACILLLNSDTEVPKNSIQVALQELKKDTSAGVLTTKLVLPRGNIDPACHRGFPTPWAALTYFTGLEKLFPTSPVFSQYHMGYKNMSVVHEIDAPSGAFFLVKREVIEKVGLLDEDYFMYGEDIDWAYRIKQAGYKILYDPNVSVFHKKKQSGRANTNKQVKKRTTMFFYQTMQLFYKKHYQEKYPFIVTWMVSALLDVRVLFVKLFGF